MGGIDGGVAREGWIEAGRQVGRMGKLPILSLAGPLMLAGAGARTSSLLELHGSAGPESPSPRWVQGTCGAEEALGASSGTTGTGSHTVRASQDTGSLTTADHSHTMVLGSHSFVKRMRA